MADNVLMKTTTLASILFLSLLVSCVDTDSKDDTVMVPATGNISKAWVKDGNTVETITSLDLSDPASIKAVGVGKRVKVIGYENKTEIIYSDCEFSSTGPQMTDGMKGFYETTLVSGDSEICGQFVPMFSIRHYRYEGESKEFLGTSFGRLQ